MELREAHEGQEKLPFIDVKMPSALDGFQLAQRIAPRWSDIGVLVASGRRKPRDGEMPEQAIFIGKPFSPEVVRDRSKALLPDSKKPEPLRSA